MFISVSLDLSLFPNHFSGFVFEGMSLTPFHLRSSMRSFTFSFASSNNSSDGESPVEKGKEIGEW